MRYAKNLIETFTEIGHFSLWHTQGADSIKILKILHENWTQTRKLNQTLQYRAESQPYIWHWTPPPIHGSIYTIQFCFKTLARGEGLCQVLPFLSDKKEAKMQSPGLNQSPFLRHSALEGRMKSTCWGGLSIKEILVDVTFFLDISGHNWNYLYVGIILQPRE